ncbi:SWIM zinc finger family protein [Melittangium boletus]|uniref:SWIM zinc finger family protein n=1 Tax=Melittangium boletus TaxID=83453 RepID=UPI003DA25575
MASSTLTVEQVLALAPDASAAAAGRKLGAASHWTNPGRAAHALWGECRGSALYQVRVDLGDLSSKCSCPSRKLPCKHALGLLVLFAGGHLPEAPPPEWVTEWLERRAASSERKEKRKATLAEGAPPADPQAQSRRTSDRQERVSRGLEAMRAWMEDLVRMGFASLEPNTDTWSTQAARLVDAQAPGMASRVRRLAEIPGTGPGWPRRLLDALGRLALAAEAWGRRDTLPAPLQEDLRTLVGFSLREEEVEARGEQVHDTWTVLSHVQDDEERVRVQRTYLMGTTTGRIALVLQFAAGRATFTDSFLPGSAFDARCVFWPSAVPRRAKVLERRGEVHAWTGPLPALSIEDLGQRFAQELSQNPFQDSTPVLLGPVTPLRDAHAHWWLRDATGAAVRLGGANHWSLLALSGGQPLEVFGDWDGEHLWPLGARVGRILHPLKGVTS